jgi:hypothetical protein
MSVTKREAAHGVDRVTRFQGENATMNSPILPVGGPSGPQIPSSSTATVTGDFSVELDAGENTFAIEVARGGPPPLVLEQIAAAGAIEEGLRAAGQQVRFQPAGPGEPTQIELHERDGAVRTLSLGEAFELAAGTPLA